MSRHTPRAHVSKSRSFPTTRTEIIDLLDEMCPEPVVHPGQSEAEIMFAAGQRSVALMIRKLFEDTFTPE